MPENSDRSRIMLNLLESVERDGSESQRGRASEYGVALGLVNAYLKYFVKKGYVKVKKIPAQNYVYFLTPKGFAEKSKLSIALISNSFAYFRQARKDYSAIFRNQVEGRRAALLGMSEFAEVAVICAAEQGLTLAGIVDATSEVQSFLGISIVRSLEDLTANCAVVTAIRDPQALYDAACGKFGADKVFAPSILPIVRRKRPEAAE
jgi:hypothetical protein